ncbi:SunS family peptide S-glycosyltransferase [Gottfriedia acidiceleris]|uniref:SunS family peptide S-glycosyltransferase n=1 Tax=Gottfriedia acidiceleris TaxID=371036 RepID=UPI000B442E4D|nr:SunS family peptide S-glycosyltransferase [Gottfriedia acidiceleris]
MGDLKNLFKNLNLNFPGSSLLKDIHLIREINTINYIEVDYTGSLEEMVERYENLKSPSITCGILTFNEERCIKRCLESVIDEFDKIIIIDSLSTDNTIDIIKHYFPSVEILSENWINDFSFHRNKVIEHASSDWIYFIDADNIYDIKNQGKAKRIAKLIDFLKIKCVVSPMIIEHNGHIYTETRRLFPLKNKILFKGKVHEEPVFIDNTIPNHMSVDIYVHHDGYSPKVVNQIEKNQRNIALTREMINIEPKNPKWLFFYARELEQANDDSTLIKNVLFNALDLYNSSSDKRYYLDTMLLLCKILFLTRDFKELSEILKSLEQTFPNCLDIAYYKATLFFIDIQLKVKKLINYLQISLDNSEEIKYSLINSTNDHIKYSILKLHCFLGEWEQSISIYKNLESEEIKKEYLDYVNDLKEKLNEVL